MPIPSAQLALITEGHALGLNDAAIAQHAGVSLSSVKRYRSRLRLPTTSATQLRGKQGERLLVRLAVKRGLHVVWAPGHNAEYDLVIGSARVDVKASMQRPDGTWRFRLPPARPSFHGEYSYPKDYATDCDLLALVALFPDDRDPDVYFIESATAPINIVLRPGGVYDAFRNDWTAFEGSTFLAA